MWPAAGVGIGVCVLVLVVVGVEVGVGVNWGVERGLESQLCVYVVEEIDIARLEKYG